VLNITDVHQHLIYPERYDYAWTADIPVLAHRAFRYEDYLRAAQGCGIGSAVFMEATASDPAEHDEAAFVQSLTTDERCPIVGVVAACRPEHDRFEQFLDDLAGSRVVGLRRILHVVDDDVSRSARFRENVRMLGERRLSFDLCFRAQQLPIAAELASACPQVSFVLDHCGGPDIAAGGLDPWRNDVRTLADLPNVACKISGVLANCDPEHADRSAVAPYIEHCIESFGWDRVVWGSDWPLVEINSSLRDWVAITRGLVAAESERNQRELFAENACRVYGLERLAVGDV
jgi:predicted TIM-barrel fold metal-dependent hydrolase